MAKPYPAADLATERDGAPQSRNAQILDIARRLFGEKGYDRTSLRDIAEAAGVTKAALYYHFPDKDALYHKVVIESMQQLLDVVQAAVDAQAEPVAQLRAFFHASVDFYETHPYYFQAGSNSFQVQTGDKRLMAVALRDRYEEILRGCVRRAIDTDVMRAIDVPLLGRYLLSSFNQISRWHTPGGALTVRQVTDQYLDFALHGVLLAR